MKILLALGADPAAPLLAGALGLAGWSVLSDPDGRDAVHHAEDGGLDAALVGAALPDAPRLLARLRAAAPDLAAMALGTEPSLALKARLFDAGADDVLAHPVEAEEVAMRARAIARRRHGHRERAIPFGNLAVHLGSHAEVDGMRLQLSPSEFTVLERLALCAGRALDRDTLLSALHGGQAEPCAKLVDVFVCRIRKVLSRAGAAHDLIETVQGRGWRLPPSFVDPSRRQGRSETSREIRMAARAAGAAA